MNSYSGLIQTGVASSSACDLRSDTITRPCRGMRAAISSAEVGDDVYGEDPIVTKLERMLAEMMGKESAVFFPSGTQSNLAAIMAHCERGDEIIIGDNYHVYRDEAAGAAVLGGISLFAVKTELNGALTPETVLSAIKDDDPHYARSRLVSLENTVSGQAISLPEMESIYQTAKDRNLSIHLDGARFFNAITTLNCDAKELAKTADTISICLSKGLGAPVGSVLVGDQKTILSARRLRKLLGGAMRQVGILAAAGIYALENNIETLKNDHDRAARLKETLATLDFGNVRSATNMVFFTPPAEHHKPLIKHMAHSGVLIGGQFPTIRMVLHRDVDDEKLEIATDAFRSYAA